MKKLAIVIPFLLVALFLIPSSAQGKSTCQNLRDEAQRHARNLASTQAELVQKKINLVDERHEARRLTNIYNQARIRYQELQLKIISGLTPAERRELARLSKKVRKTKRQSLAQGRVVKKLERETKKLGAKTRALQRAYEVTKRNLKRNNC